MMARLLPNPFLTLTFWAIWVALGNEWSAAQVLSGLLVALLIPMLMRPFWRPTARVRRPLLLVLFLLHMQRDIVVANLAVARRILGPVRRLRPAFVEVPLDVHDDFVITLLTSVISLTPGTVVADVSPDRRRLLVHALDTRDPSAVIHDIKHRYERPLMEIFGCSPTR